MNKEIAGDVRFFLAAVLLGILAALLYDLLRVWRRFHRQTLFVVSVQDFLYWFFLGLLSFRLMYIYNAGTVRFFAFLGIGLGALLYMVSIGRLFVKYCLKLLLFFTFPLRKGLHFLRKKGKLIRNRWTQFRKRKEHGRKDALAAKKQKKKDRTKTPSVGGADDVRRTDIQQGEGGRQGKETHGEESLLRSAAGIGGRTSGGAGGGGGVSSDKAVHRRTGKRKNGAGYAR